jgi:hypothetical protein
MTTCLAIQPQETFIKNSQYCLPVGTGIKKKQAKSRVSQRQIAYEEEWKSFV